VLSAEAEEFGNAQSAGPPCNGRPLRKDSRKIKQTAPATALCALVVHEQKSPICWLIESGFRKHLDSAKPSGESH